MPRPWLKPGTEPSQIKRFHNDILFRRRILATGMFGQRLVTAFQEMYHEIWWDYANPDHVTFADVDFTPNVDHIRSVVGFRNPKLIITFGANTHDSVVTALEDGPHDDIPMLSCPPHDNRFRTQADINGFATEVRTWCAEH